ncbi:fibroleukin-like [Anopheles aquasalis]|uniref:fibroleukin-like n=1 Tax=Anopheles aquasalis TaxID=42839 RepID=UPI00215B390A|nr:fibroleukin-like [Anopheles aquasalis]
MNHRSSQEQSQKEIMTVLHKLENQVAFNLREVHNRDQEVNTALHKLDKEIEHELYKQYSQLTFSSCKDVPSKISGTYLIRVKRDSEPFEVYCEQKSFGGGWIVFQYRYDGSLEFYRGWHEFHDGFGDLNKEFWLGLEKVHQITSARKHELVVELKDFNGTYKYARYDAFEIGSESEQYNLKDIGKYSGTAGDEMSNYKGRKISTKHHDNAENSMGHCAQRHEGAWWHWYCNLANLNGQYMDVEYEGSGAFYYFDGSFDQRLRYSRMMIREKE